MTMERFNVNKFIAYVEASDAAVREYVADPVGYVQAWVARGAASRVPVADGGPLSPESAAALGATDYATLYRMGAHPYILWHFAEAALVWAGDKTWPELKEEFRAAVAADGNPDFTT